MSTGTKRLLSAFVLTSLMGLTAAAQTRSSPRDALVERAKAVELDTPYVAPPGDPLEHDASGFAKVMCAWILPFMM